MFDYLVREDDFLPVREIDVEGVEALDSDLRRSILEAASAEKVKVSDLVEKFDRDRQTLYYNIRKLEEAGLVDSTDTKPKMYSAESSAFYFRPEGVEPEENPLMLENVPEVLQGFIEERQIRARIIVGAPYPHGEYERRHRTSYKAGEVSAVLGNYGKRRQQLIYMDTELNAELKKRPLISVAGPLVNIFTAELNSEMPAKFTKTRDRIITESESYSADETGIIAREEVDGQPRMMVAGMSGIGTSSAIKALSSRASELGEKGAVVEGYGTKHDIEEVKILEKLEQ